MFWRFSSSVLKQRFHLLLGRSPRWTTFPKASATTTSTPFARDAKEYRALKKIFN
jgi:hypothetical protein